MVGTEHPLQPAEVLEIEDLGTLKVMADPLRMRVVDLLRRRSASVKEIAADLEVPAKSLYYHVNLLEKHELIRVVETRLVSGIAEKRYRATAYLFNFSESKPSKDMPPARIVLDTIGSMIAITQDELRISIESGVIDVEHPEVRDMQLQLDWELVDLSPAELTELSTRFRTLIEEIGRSSTGTRATRSPHRIFALLFPTYRRGERPDSSDPD